VVKVVDTSVVIKWFVDEGDNEAAIGYIGTALAAPELLLAEVGNALWKKRQKDEMPVEQIHMVTAFVKSFVEILSGEPVAEAAVGIALELKHPVYDCYYLAMAEELGTTVLTFDRRLRNTCIGTRFEGLIEYLGTEK
jgi:predicted nucleic acid-binding protein